MIVENCARCGEAGDDRRTLWMACLYDMSELGVPFAEAPSGRGKFYTLRVCKDCRADWLEAIRAWFSSPPARESCGSGIFVRRNGATVEITREEWDRENPGREPVIVDLIGAGGAS